MSKPPKSDQPRVREREMPKASPKRTAQIGVNGQPVGYGNPPKSGQWVKGMASPNGKGRPKKARNYKTILQELLNSEVAIRDANGTRKISARRAYLMKILDKALKGETRAVEILLRMEAALEAAALEAEQLEKQIQNELASQENGSDIPDSFLDDYFKERKIAEKKGRRKHENAR